MNFKCPKSEEKRKGRARGEGTVVYLGPRKGGGAQFLKMSKINQHERGGGHGPTSAPNTPMGEGAGVFASRPLPDTLWIRLWAPTSKIRSYNEAFECTPSMSIYAEEVKKWRSRIGKWSNVLFYVNFPMKRTKLCIWEWWVMNTLNWRAFSKY